MGQDKAAEKKFFAAHAETLDYDVFAPETNALIVRRFMALTGVAPGGRVADLGCGSGVFSEELRRQGYVVAGLDLCRELLAVGQRRFELVPFVTGDVEKLPFPDACLDGVLLSGIVHHLPDPGACAAEVYRVLKPGGAFMAFDPNRLNPFMWLYRDRASPFYSNVGVTENERPVIPDEIAGIFAAAGFAVRTNFLSGLEYRYVASSLVRRILPIYNAIDSLLFSVPFLARHRAFVLTSGTKP